MKLKLKQPRKIVSFKYSFLVSLPLTWLRAREIGKGDFVDFIINEDGDLIVRPIKQTSK